MVPTADDSQSIIEQQLETSRLRKLESLNQEQGKQDQGQQQPPQQPPPPQQQPKQQRQPGVSERRAVAIATPVPVVKKSADAPAPRLLHTVLETPVATNLLPALNKRPRVWAATPLLAGVRGASLTVFASALAVSVLAMVLSFSGALDATAYAAPLAGALVTSVVSILTPWITAVAAGWCVSAAAEAVAAARLLSYFAACRAEAAAGDSSDASGSDSFSSSGSLDGSSSSSSSSSGEEVPLSLMYNRLVQHIQGDPRALPRLTSLVTAMGSTTLVCCVDREGILSESIPLVERVLLPHAGGSGEDAPAAGADTVLELAPDRHSSTGVRFESLEWRDHMSALLPVGLAAVLLSAPERTEALNEADAASRNPHRAREFDGMDAALTSLGRSMGFAEDVASAYEQVAEIITSHPFKVRIFFFFFFSLSFRRECFVHELPQCQRKIISPHHAPANSRCL
jgi:hypothetical protein